MKSEEKIIIAFLFKRSGKQNLTEKELYLPMSMELQWCKPQQAKNFVKKALERNLLKKTQEGLKPAFKPEQISIPVGYSPSEKFFKKFEEKTEKQAEEQKVKYQNILNEIAENTDEQIEKVQQRLKNYAEQKNIFYETAVLVEAEHQNVNTQDFSKMVKKQIFQIK